MKVVAVKNKPVLLVSDPTPRLTDIGKPCRGGVIIPHTVIAENILRSEGVTNVPSVVDRYSWPGAFEPFTHQIEMVKFRMIHRRLWDLSGMRTGKTPASVWGLDLLMRQNLVSRVLILSPLSVVRDAWMKTLGLLIPYRDFTEATGATKTAGAALRSGAEIVVANHDKVKFNYEDILAFKPDLVIVDESTTFKGWSSDRYKALRSIVTKTKCRFWALTATPASQKATDPWAIARLVNRQSVPFKYTDFRNDVMVQVGDPDKNIWVNRQGWEKKVRQALQPAVRFRTQDCIDMPAVVEIMRFCQMGTKQTRYYNKMKRHGTFYLDGSDITAKTAATKINKLRQVSSGMAYDKKAETVVVDASSKLAELTQIIDESDGKVLVFTPFRNVMQYLHDALTGKGYSAAVLDRAHSLDKRTRTFNAFQEDGDPQVLVMHPQIAKYGLTLTAAHTTVWWGPVYSVETFSQANMRMMGPQHENKSKCSVIMLYSTPEEEKIYRGLLAQDDMSLVVIDSFKSAAGIRS